jgi:aryl-alcohol dehydrogenase-like predicted oxidoreductase
MSDSKVPKIRKTTLGSQGAVVSRMGLGCLSMSEMYGEPNEEESLATILRALDLGLNFFDTADIYGLGHNEELLSKVLRSRRDEIFLASKFGYVREQGSRSWSVNGKPEYVRAACEASLRRLGVDHIDLYYQHRVDPETPIEETVGAMSELVRAGKVRYLGLSEASAATIRRAHEVFPITAVETEYSLFERHAESEVLPTTRELGIGFVPYSPLGRGLLTGTISDPSRLDDKDARLERYPRFAKGNLEKNLVLVEHVRAIANRRQVTPSQLALSWIFAKGEDIVPIPGTKRRKYLEENAAAAAIKLTSAEIAEIESAVPHEAVAGARYTESIMQDVDRSDGNA